MKKGYITVVIPVYKDVDGLKDTLVSLKEQLLPAIQFQVIVGNDGHHKGISALCKKYHVMEVFTEKNQGSYTIRDLAIEQSTGEYICFTDADIKVPQTWLENILKGFQAGSDYIGGNVGIDPKKIRTLTNEFVSFYEFDNEPLFKTAHFTATANVHVRRSVIETLGGFDRRLVSAGDLEFGNRVYLSKKFKQKFQKDIMVIHPPRGYHEFLKKLRRISGGENDLARLYPDRFKKFNKSFYSELREALYFPKLPNTLPEIKRIQLTLLGLWFQLYRAGWNIKNRNFANNL